MKKIFHFPLRHHSCLIKLTLLQLHHHTSLIKLMNISSLHHNYNTCSILKLHYSNITSHYSVFIHLQIPSDIQLSHLPSIFVSLTQRCAPYSISNYIWNTSKLLLLSGDVKINPGLQPVNQNPVFCIIYSNKINQGAQQNMAPTCSDEKCIKPVMVYLSAKLVVRKIPITLSPASILKMTLESPKLSCHLLQFMNLQIVPLL